MFKKNIQILIIILFFVLPVLIKAEDIKNYKINIKIQKDSSFLVDEIIDYDFGYKRNHGIFRFIPVLFDVSGQKKWGGLVSRKIEIDQLEVYRNNKKEKISELDKRTWKGNYYIKIGEKGKLLSGVQKYRIKYRVKGGLRSFDDYNEFYWNVIGLDWPVEIKKVSVILKSEDNFLNFKDYYCYYGGLKSKKECFSEKKDGDIFFSLANSLQANKGMTISASFKKGELSVVELWDFNWKGLILIIFSGLFLILYFLWLYAKRFLNYFKPNEPVIPIYKPHQNYHPAITGYLIDRKFDNRDLVAGLINLAQHGYVDIEEIEEWGGRDYLFKLKKDNPDDMLDRYFLNFLFKDNNLKKSEIRVSQFKEKPLLTNLNRKEIESWLVSYGEDKKLILKNKKNKIVFLLIVVFISIFASVWFSPVFTIILIILSIPLGMLAEVINTRYSLNGWRVRNRLEGFKLFLSMTEKERIEFFNPPGTDPKEFLEYLPYAIAFGVEKKWQEQFKNIDITMPNWYKGNINSFKKGVFVSEIFQHTESISHTFQSSSGSRGGGFSGGGSGGGGGGSW